MPRSWYRLVPALGVGVLLLAAAFASSRGAHACCSISAPAATYPNCGVPLQQQGGGTAFVLDPLAGVTQPFNVVGNVSACSLSVQKTIYGYGEMDLYQWDPIALAPDPTTVALRTAGFDASSLQYSSNSFRADFRPPVVLRALTGLADPPAPENAMDFSIIYSYSGSRNIYYEPDGSSSIPFALEYSSGLPRSPLPGNHPVLAHLVCGGDANLQGMYVVQSVMTCSALSDTGAYEMIQRFRVPVSTKLHWIELAFGINSVSGFGDPGVIAIYDAQGMVTAPAPLPASLVEAFYSNCDFRTPFWGTHYDFDHLITLEPGHDYWLMARVRHEYLLYERALTGGEPASFTSGVGELYRRPVASGPWTAVPGRALSFRVIGEPLGVLDVTPPRPIPSGLRLRVTPNPARGGAFVSWFGAAGTVCFDVLDARGRRVGGGTAASGATGRWLWRGARDDGRQLPAGVYFVRGTDGFGHVAIERAVLIR